MQLKNITYIAILCFHLAGCGGGNSGPPETSDWSHLQSISFANNEYEVIIGNSKSIVVGGGEGTGAVIYSSSDTNILTVTNDGLVSAITLGNATVTATKEADSIYSSASASASVEVTPKKEQTIAFDIPKFTLVIGDVESIVASGGEGTGAITYSSSDEAIISITADGVATANVIGSAVITAVKAADDMYEEATATITVDVVADAIELAAPEISSLSTGNSRTQISWSGVQNATSYNLYRAKESIDSIEVYATLDGGTLFVNVTSPFIQTGLTNGQGYYYVATAVAGESESVISNQLLVVPRDPLNDTGLLKSGNAQSGVNATCTDIIQNDGHVPQDCDQGRDADPTVIAAKVGSGSAAFDLTKLGSDGAALAIQDGTWSADGSESDGTLWSCVKDNHTGLVWEVKTIEGPHSFEQQNKVNWSNRDVPATTSNDEVFCGITSWRVPTVVELITIANNNRQNPAFVATHFPNGKSQSYWTSLPVAGNSANAWTINFYSGIGNSKAKTMNFQVRLVSGDYTANDTSTSRYLVNGDGTATDLVTGLMWKQCPEGLSGDDCSAGTPATLVWGGSMKAARDSTFAGYSDWRLPNMKEFQSIVAFDKYNPAINTEVFPNPGAVLSFWTSTPRTLTSPVNQSWRINFAIGLNEAKNRTGSQNSQMLVRDAD
jgi:hypothetical protein